MGILAELNSTFVSLDNLINASFKPMEPTNFAVRGRSTIGSQPGPLPSMVFNIGNLSKGEVGLQIYVLPGGDLCNIVITMRRQIDADGYCGNFNCDWADDSEKALAERAPELAAPVPNTSSLFPAALASPPGWDVRKGPPPAVIMKQCKESTKQNAGCDGMSSAPEKEACEFDACMAAYKPPNKTSNASEERLFNVAHMAGAGLSATGSWWSQRSTRVSSVALVGVAAVLFLFKPTTST